MGMVEMGVVLAEMGRAVHPGPFLSSAVGAVSLVLAAGGHEDHERLLPDLASGAAVGAVGLLEPGSRYDWRSPATRSVRRGEVWQLTGTKVHVLDAMAADLLLLAARTGDGLGVFAVEREAPGVEIVSSPTVDATRKQGTVSLTDAPGLRLSAGDATEAIARVADRMLVALVADGVGAAERVLELTLEHAKARHQFGRPVGSFQAVQHLCADMLQALELARAGTYFAVWADGSGSEAIRHRAATMAKAYSSDALVRIGASAIQVLGGIGFTWDHDAHLYYKRLLTMAHTLGGSTEHLEELAGLVLDEPVSDGG
jgi:alkylation response protein AidB-like acyl-CoA dehydrogenase